MEKELLMLLMKEREAKHFEQMKRSRKEIRSVFDAIDVFAKTIEYGICPITAKSPLIVNSTSALRTLERVLLGQRFIVLIGGCNGQELHEASKIDEQGRILETSVIDGFATYQIKSTHQIRNSDNL